MTNPLKRVVFEPKEMSTPGILTVVTIVVLAVLIYGEVKMAQAENDWGEDE